MFGIIIGRLWIFVHIEAGVAPCTLLKEAVVLTSLSGYLGLVAGVAALEGLAKVIQRLPNAPLNQPEIDVKVALAAMLVLVVSGTLAGVVPARHAARISPVEALRTE